HTVDQTVERPLARSPFGDSPPPATGVVARAMDTLRLVRDQGGPGFTQFALNNACNANCGFCGFARETFPKDKWKFADREGGLEAIDILYRQGTRYLLFTGGEPTLHPNLLEFTAHAH